jgi:acyl carrier protein
MTVLERMQQVIREVLDDDQLVLTDALTARDVEGWDSLGHINIMFALESEFGVQFDDDQLSRLHDVGQLRRFIEQATGD